MKWTTEKPTKPGWYWIRVVGFVKVVWADEAEADRLIEALNPQWAGPIPEPED